MPVVTKRMWASADTAWLDVFVLTFVPREGAAPAITIPYGFDNSIVMADPGTGDVRTNNAVNANVTEMAMSATDDLGNDQTTALNTLLVGQRIALVQDSTRLFVGIVSAAITNNTTWFLIPVAVAESDGTFQNNADVTFHITSSSSLPQGTDHLEVQMALEWPWVPYRIFNEGETAPKEEGVFSAADIRSIVIL
jgi:hypothetical protein